MPLHVAIARDQLLLDDAAEAALPAGIAPVKRHGDGLSLNAIFEDLSGGDLFSEQRAFIYSNFLAMRLGKKEGERLAAMLADINAQTTLICLQLLNFDSRADEKKKLGTKTYEYWTGSTKVKDARNESEGASGVRYLRERAKERYGLVLSAGQVERLLAASGEKLSLADRELAKLELLKATDTAQQVPDKLLDATLSSNPAAQFFELQDALLEGRRGALTHLRRWHGITGDTYSLLYQLARKLMNLRILAQGGQVYPPWQARQLKPLQGRWRGDKAGRGVMAVARAEFRLKSGQLTGMPSNEAELAALEMLGAELIELARGR